MWKLLIRHRLRRCIDRNADVTAADILNASSILFSVFGRYGDSIIAFKVISEFMARYPDKSCILVTSPQMVPYAGKIVGGKLEVHAVNKRKNPVRLLMLMRELGKRAIDLGLNPWSHGDDSIFFITFARKFSNFGAFSNVSKEHNLYRRVREYLVMPEPGTRDSGLEQTEKRAFPFLCESRVPGPGSRPSILISPFSTDVTKSLGESELDALICQVRHRFPGARITVAMQRNEKRKLRAKTDFFIFGKSMRKSDSFLNLMKATDLFIGVDAGPLHLADALGINAIGIFGPTAPESILDRSSSVFPIRHSRLSSIFCFNTQCKQPACIQELFSEDFLLHSSKIDFNRKIELVTEKCLLTNQMDKVR
jgi:ADP-heptose:LPS heptosyltransferase